MGERGVEVANDDAHQVDGFARGGVLGCGALLHAFKTFVEHAVVQFHLASGHVGNVLHQAHELLHFEGRHGLQLLVGVEIVAAELGKKVAINDVHRASGVMKNGGASAAQWPVGRRCRCRRDRTNREGFAWG